MVAAKNSMAIETVAFSSMADLPILVVDDLHLLRQLLKSYLEKEGFTNIHIAEDGQKALEMVESIRPSLVVLDIVMPVLDGFEVCRQLRSNPQFSELPIIVQTGMEESGERLQVFKEGANDLVIKPVNGAELVARVKVHLQNAILQKQQRQYQKRMADELDAARQVQESLLPSLTDIQNTEKDVGLSIAAHYRASSELGGDFWGMQTLDNGKLAIYSVDFAGHGVVSALNTFRLHTLITSSDWDWENPTSWLSSVNENLCKLLSIGQFATIFYAVIDTEKNSLEYASAGAPPVLVGGVDGASSYYLDTAGLPAGISLQATYETTSVLISKGLQVIIYSDALIETADLAGEILDEDKLLSVADEALDLVESEQKLGHILNAFPGNNLDPLPDDLTLICITQK